MAVGVAWITTTLQSSMWRPEILKIVRAEITQAPNGSWVLWIEAINIGEGRAEIYKIVVQDKEEIKLEPPITIEPSQQREFSTTLKQSYTPNTFYTIRLYLRSGTVYSYIVYRAQAK